VLGTLARMPQRHGRVVEDRGQLLLQARSAQLDRRRLRRGREHGCASHVQLDCARRLRHRNRLALQLKHCLWQETLELGAQRRLLDHGLQDAGSVPDDEEQNSA
jgi:hypothetical protein